MNTDKIIAEAIAKEYAPKESTRLLALRKLDRMAKLPATIIVYVNGIIMTLLFGMGLSMTMGSLIISEEYNFIVGIFLGIFGLFGIVINYPLYLKNLKKGKDKYAFDIIEIAKQISER